MNTMKLKLEKDAPACVGFDMLHLQSLASVKAGIEDALACAAGHSLNGKGSLNRAKLATEIAGALGMSPAHSRQIGGSIEFFHLASLILDDLPCMDNATLRRGQPCTHLLYGESTAILTAMGFINRAYCLLWEVFSDFPVQARKDAAKLTDQCLGFQGILNGQARDIAFGESSMDAREVLEIARLKTGSLLRLCILLPAILAGSDRDVKMRLASLSDLWGIAYQISDDLKDVFCGEGVSGKTACRDDKLGRPNLTLAIGVEGAMSLLSELIQDSETTLTLLAVDHPKLADSLCKFQKNLVGVSRELAKVHFAA